ncbi:hypothetical protein K2173_000596 [Erythroxylum novogranatense]|uniref:SAWADEE domain-containing protein n=1 Tax=Erythroxylum novogranatense TaxID=1862640 RepID=A0AAV8S807_9ROSI|nr:hypothetical protein K2173_000596 [Erythroxylum novogranatense]
MLQPKDCFADPLSPSVFNVELRWHEDDAWYSVRTLLDGDELTVKFQNFSELEDVVLYANRFSSLEKLQQLKNRFRPISAQLQDNQCSKVLPGSFVCASHSFNDLDIRFYDAVVDDVFRKDHSFEKGEEECLCTFILVWQHGPLAGFVANKKIENVCLVESTETLDPTVSTFFEIAMKKLNIAHMHCKDGSPSCTDVTLSHKSSTLCKTPKSIFGNRKGARRSSVKVQPLESADQIETYSGKDIKEDAEETDMGGADDQSILLIDNLDKDLLPSSIVEFIHAHTSISVRAYISPSLPSETYTKGAIMLDCKKNLESLNKFLDSPNHIIVSCRGRPLVVAEKLSGHNMFKIPSWSLMLKFETHLPHRTTGINNDLRVVYPESDEYGTVKRLRDLFMEFTEHQHRLHKRLALEERKILQPSTSNRNHSS